jgi:DNA repair exonuclease SbcCD ATPase subunit
MTRSTSSLRRKVDRKLAALRSARDRLRAEAEAHEDSEARERTLEAAQELAQHVAQTVQSQAHAQIAGIVTRCLRAVFDDPYDFEIEFQRKRGRTEARLLFQRDGAEVDPLTASGGGVVDVAAFALRLSALVLARPPLRKLLVLDEPFRFVSAEYREKVRILLESLAEDMDVQILMVTHDPALRAGNVVMVRP